METANNNEKIWTLVMKCYSEECNDADKLELEHWLNSAPENEKIYQELLGILKNADAAMKINEIDENKAWQYVRAGIHLKNKKVKRLNLMVRVAAFVILMFGIAAMLFLWQNRGVRMNKTITDAKEVITVTLPDGSEVTLNANSEFVYPEKFTGNVRNVVLKGEAFFKVAQDTKRPFIVTAGRVTVKVVGTEFNVKAYNESGESVVSVESGIVKVAAENKTVLLKKGESASFDKKNKTLKKSFTKDVNVLAWKTKQIVFENTPLRDALKTIKEVYKVDVQIEDTTLLKNKIINANFDKQSAGFILKTICETYHFSLEQNNDKYIISSGPSR